MSSSPAISGRTAPSSVRALAASAQEVQRNRLFQPERTGPRAAQHGDVADGVQGQGDVAREAADVGALGDGGGEGDEVRRRVQTTESAWMVTARAFISTSSPARARS